MSTPFYLLHLLKWHWISKHSEIREPWRGKVWIRCTLLAARLTLTLDVGLQNRISSMMLTGQVWKKEPFTVSRQQKRKVRLNESPWCVNVECMSKANFTFKMRTLWRWRVSFRHVFSAVGFDIFLSIWLLLFWFIMLNTNWMLLSWCYKNKNTTKVILFFPVPELRES